MTATARSPRAEKAPPLTEKAFQRQVVELAKLLGWRCYHPFLSKWSERGFPDLTLVRGQRLVFAELKTDHGKVSSFQAEWQGLLAEVSRGNPGVEVYLWRPADFDAIQAALR